MLGLNLPTLLFLHSRLQWFQLLLLLTFLSALFLIYYTWLLMLVPVWKVFAHSQFGFFSSQASGAMFLKSAAFGGWFCYFLNSIQSRSLKICSSTMAYQLSVSLQLCLNFPMVLSFVRPSYFRLSFYYFHISGIVQIMINDVKKVGKYQFSYLDRVISASSPNCHLFVSRAIMWQVLKKYPF